MPLKLLKRFLTRIDVWLLSEEGALERKGWHKKPLSVILLYVFTTTLFYLNWRIATPAPAPGVAVAVLAVAAAVMALLGEMGGREKVAWIFLFFGFASVELHSINTERTSQEDMQKEARRNFGEINEGLKSTKTGLDDTAKKIGETSVAIKGISDEMTAGLNTTKNTVTGGDTFCYVDFEFNPIWENGKPTKKGLLWLAAMRVGKYPLRGISVTVDDHIRYSAVLSALRKQDTKNFTIPASEEIQREMLQAQQASETTLQVGDFAIDSKSIGGYPMNDGDTQEFDVLVRSFNRQTLIERVSLKRTDDHWSKAILVELPTKTNRYWTKIDKDFPRRSDGHLDVNWPRSVKGREPWDH